MSNQRLISALMLGLGGCGVAAAGLALWAIFFIVFLTFGGY